MAALDPTRFQRPLSKAECVEMAQTAWRDPALVGTLIKTVEDRLPGYWRAAWVLDTLADEDKSAIATALGRIISLLENELDAASTRCLLRVVLSQKCLPEDLEGRLFDISLAVLDKANTTVGTAMPALDLGLRLSVTYPNLWPELALRVERWERVPAPAVQSVLKKVRATYAKRIAPALRS